MTLLVMVGNTVVSVNQLCNSEGRGAKAQTKGKARAERVLSMTNLCVAIDALHHCAPREIVLEKE